MIRSNCLWSAWTNVGLFLITLNGYVYCEICSNNVISQCISDVSKLWFHEKNGREYLTIIRSKSLHFFCGENVAMISCLQHAVHDCDLPQNHTKQIINGVCPSSGSFPCITFFGESAEVSCQRKFDALNDKLKRNSTQLYISALRDLYECESAFMQKQCHDVFDVYRSAMDIHLLLLHLSSIIGSDMPINEVHSIIYGHESPPYQGEPYQPLLSSSWLTYLFVSCFLLFVGSLVYKKLRNRIPLESLADGNVPSCRNTPANVHENYPEVCVLSSQPNAMPTQPQMPPVLMEAPPDYETAIKEGGASPPAYHDVVGDN